MKKKKTNKKQKKNFSSFNYKKYSMKMIKEKYPYFLIGLSVCLLLFFAGFSYVFKTSGISFITNKFRKKQTKPKEIKKYVVQEGDDLWKIAEKYYGSGYNAYDIAQANKMTEPFTLDVGQTLIIPEISPRLPTQGEITPTAAATSQAKSKSSSYTVEKGDFLWKIAEKVYGDGYAQNRIIEANKLSPPYTLEPGQKLIIP